MSETTSRSHNIGEVFLTAADSLLVASPAIASVAANVWWLNPLGIGIPLLAGSMVASWTCLRSFIKGDTLAGAVFVGVTVGIFTSVVFGVTSKVLYTKYVVEKRINEVKKALNNSPWELKKPVIVKVDGKDLTFDIRMGVPDNAKEGENKPCVIAKGTIWVPDFIHKDRNNKEPIQIPLDPRRDDHRASKGTQHTL